MRPAKTQISLGIPPVWSESSLSTWRKLGSLSTHSVHSEDSDQTGRMPRLIWVFAGRTLILLVLSCRGSNINSSSLMKHSDDWYTGRTLIKLLQYLWPVQTCRDYHSPMVKTIQTIDHAKAQLNYQKELSAQWRIQLTCTSALSNRSLLGILWDCGKVSSEQSLPTASSAVFDCQLWLGCLSLKSSCCQRQWNTPLLTVSH